MAMNEGSGGGDRNIPPLSGAQPAGPQWRDAGEGEFTHIRWQEFLSSDIHVDPYMVWADLSGMAGFGGPEKTRSDGWPLLVELKAAGCRLPFHPETQGSLETCALPAEGCEVVFGMLTVAGAYLASAADSRQQRCTATRFVTGRVNPKNISMLFHSRQIVRFELGIPRLPDVSEKRDEGSQNAGPKLVDPKYRTILGVVDDGCAFAHPCFLDRAGKTRLWFLWDQDEKRKQDIFWRNIQGFGYGAELGYRQLQDASAEVKSGDEFAPYSRVDYLPVKPEPEFHAVSGKRSNGPDVPVGTMLRATHGTGAMDLAIGFPPPRMEQNAVTGDPLAIAPGNLSAAAKHDAAENWPAVFVQLPTRTVLDTSGGSLGVHMLDAVRYITRRANIIEYEEADKRVEGIVTAPRFPDRTDPEPAAVPPNGRELTYPDNTLIINISYGSIAGPHDGTSIIEDALADLVRERPKTWVVVSAGNAHRARTHGRIEMAVDGKDRQMTWRVGPDNPLETFLEIWFPGIDIDGVPIPSTLMSSVSIRIEPPGGLATVLVGPGDARVLCSENPSADGSPQRQSIPLAGAVFARRVSQSRSGTMLLIAVAPTRRPMVGQGFGLPVAPHGDWQIYVSARFSGDAAGAARRFVVHAWTQRNDLLYGIRRPQQSTVVSDEQIPEPTEFSPESLSYKARFPQGRGQWTGDEPPRAMQPDSALGSLASGAPVRRNTWIPDLLNGHNWQNRGGVVAVGAHRLADGEMAAYSSGGPSRASQTDAGASRNLPPESPIPTNPPARRNDGPVVNDPMATGMWRVAPDLDAPADIGTALRGLRVSGTRPWLTARISGTSAAAPQVARFIANYRYWATWKNVAAANGVADPLPALEVTRPPEVAESGRPAAAPRTDDLYRKGLQRIR